MTVGYQNVARACLATDLNHRDKLVLLAMANVALDPLTKSKADPLVYFAGWEYLAIVLGYPDYSSRAEATVARSIRNLTHRGYLKAIGHTANGYRKYQLILPGPT